MNWEKILTWTADAMKRPRFELGGTEISFYSVVVLIVVLIVTLWVSRLVQRAMGRTLGGKFAGKEGTLAAVKRLIHYLILLVGLTTGMQVIGINMSALFAAGAIFAIAIGFAMQNVAQNFVSGIILLAERSIKPGDILEVEGLVVRVIEMGIRTTVVRTWREEELILPNSLLSQGNVKNYTLRDSVFRLGVVVGVTYGSDMEEVARVLEETARAMPWRIDEPPPRVLLQEFGSSSVDFGVYLTVNDPWKQRVYMSELRKAIWAAFKDAGITIAFPQVDVHFDRPVAEGFAGLARAV